MTPSRSSRARLSVTLLAIFALVAVFAVRLVDIQVVRADELNEQSEGKRAVSVTSHAARGDILDTNGTPLADSVMRYDVTASPQNMGDLDRRLEDGSKVTVPLMDVVREIAETLGTDVAALQARVQKQLTDDPDSNFMYIKQGITAEQMAAVKALKVPWLYYDNRPSRTYPNGAVAGNLVGFLNTDGPGAGLELTENDCLKATNGSSTYERGMDGVQIPGSTVTEKEAVDGGTLQLTIDADLQWFAQQRISEQATAIGADWATAVVVRVSDGHIMALADYPTVDPNNVDASNVLDLGSRAFSTPYEPGSTFKGMTAAMLVDQGLADAGTKVTVPGALELSSGDVIQDSFGHPTMQWTLAGIVQQSSNIGISMLADGMSDELRYDYMKKFGLGEETEVDFNGESGGILPHHERWGVTQSANISFGQGVSTTSAQVASIFQTLGNGGVRMPLTLVEGCTMPDGTVISPSSEGARVVSEHAADSSVHMMETVVTGGFLKNQLQIPGYRVSAKSGTAEWAENGVYTDERVVSIAGVAPAEDPKYAVVVTFGKPDTIKTSAAAAPTFRKIMTQVLTMYRVPPSTEPAPNLPTTW
ncbi:penicillin-binding protein 2 [Diaminobutyricimonas sp. TR449]|uniref:peptidoglycan D,D-transpeptidase FtsI family protein n=1 Tax=Diaminobutyricimonas sp. TR449 TaxID=2708076 RepID=UPI0014228BD7|nr:penicillin-binding protein 2 [Diaminobutyricimonas sp. TR449]